MRRYFYNLHSSTLHLVLYWWGKILLFSFFGKKYNAGNKYTCVASKRTPLVTIKIDLEKSQNKGKCLLLCLEVSGGSSNPRSSSSTAFTNKARHQNPHQPCASVHSSATTREKSFKTKKKVAIHWRVQSDAI